MIKRNIVKFAVGVLTVAVLVPLFVYASDKNTDIEAHKAQAEESQSSAMTDFVEDTLEEEPSPSSNKSPGEISVYEDIPTSQEAASPQEAVINEPVGFIEKEALLPTEPSHGDVIREEENYIILAYTEPPNADSSIYIEYPWFRGEEFANLNELIYDKVLELGTINTDTASPDWGLIADYQAEVTFQSSKVVSIVFWGDSYFTTSNHPWGNLRGLTVDLDTMEEIMLNDLYPFETKEFCKLFFSYAAFPGEPITGYEEADFFEFFPRFPYYTPLEKIYGGEDNFFLLPEGVVISIPAVHATGSDHLEALLPYSLAMDFYLPDQNYWEES